MAQKKKKGLSEEELLERLGELKSQKRELEGEIEDLQAEIKRMENELTSRSHPIEKAETASGTLHLVRKPNYKVPDNLELIDQSSVTRSIFLQKAKMNMTDIKKVLADGEMEELIEKGVIKDCGMTMYYQLKD